MYIGVGKITLPQPHAFYCKHLCMQTDKTINGHMILLQLGSVRPHWRTFGGAAGVDEETLDMVRHHPSAKVLRC